MDEVSDAKKAAHEMVECGLKRKRIELEKQFTRSIALADLKQKSWPEYVVQDLGSKNIQLKERLNDVDQLLHPTDAYTKQL